MSTRSAAPRESGVTEAFCRSRCPEHCPATTASRLHSTATGTAAQASSRPGPAPRPVAMPSTDSTAASRAASRTPGCAGAVRVGPGGIGIDRQHKPQVPCRECLGALFCQPGSQAPQPAPPPACRRPAGSAAPAPAICAHSAQGSQPAARQHRQTQQAAADQSQGPDRPGRYMDARRHCMPAQPKSCSMEAAAEIPNRIRSD